MTGKKKRFSFQDYYSEKQEPLDHQLYKKNFNFAFSFQILIICSVDKQNKKTHDV